MIVSFRHKGLKEFFETGSKRGISADFAARIGRRLNVLEGRASVKRHRCTRFQSSSAQGQETRRVGYLSERQLADHIQI